MIVKCDLPIDFGTICEIINDASIAYKGIIPADRWKEPYMSEDELRSQINAGVEFWKYVDEGSILGVMGIQYKADVTLIRHAYIRTSYRRKGIGGQLLEYLTATAKTPVLIGAWADAGWAVRFYLKHGFHLVPEREKDMLLRIYWSVPERQIETSVVLASKEWQ
ncbi:MAG: GNAT family N-acetyltransferase [Bacteroidales bacterium]|jgi:GNAT superfamily N-acetyltransferase|nr:GNAT family N-acetyltransferase [Bacteroidales bacterium]